MFLVLASQPIEQVWFRWHTARCCGAGVLRFILVVRSIPTCRS